MINGSIQLPHCECVLALDYNPLTIFLVICEYTEVVGLFELRCDHDFTHLLLISDHLQQSHPGGLRLSLPDVSHYHAHDLRHSDDPGAIPHHRPVTRGGGGTEVRYLFC